VWRAALIGFALVDLAVAASCRGPPRQSWDAAADLPAAEAAPDLLPDAAACGCRVDDNDTLLLSWECYCLLPFVGCDDPLSVPASCAQRERTDYPDCGLTVITEKNGPSAELPTVYDASGKLVGRFSHREASVYVCPSDPNVWGSNIRAGLFAGAACQGITCDGCYAGAFPCPAR
jgi:hypothetical protein